MAGPKIDIVTVSYQREMALLKLQARSIRRYVDRDLINKIILIANGPSSASFLAAVRHEVLPEYGDLAPLVVLVDGECLCPGLTHEESGWRTQQAFKLIAALLVATPCYLILDTKDHFIRSVSHGSFIADDGRMISHLASNRVWLRPMFDASFAYFGVDNTRYLDESLPQTTPFLVSAGGVRSMLQWIRQKSGLPLASFFRAVFARPECQLTEFFLIAAFTILRDGTLLHDYAFHPQLGIKLFRTQVVTPEMFKVDMEHVGDDQYKTMSLHHGALEALTAAQRVDIGRAWIARGLISDLGEADAFLALASPASVDSTSATL